MMVDKKLKEVFERKELSDFIKAYAYLVNSGCYSRLESMSNALHYFDVKDISEYKLVILSNEEYVGKDELETKCDISLYSLPDNHLTEYVVHCLRNGLDVHEDAFKYEVAIVDVHVNDIDYILKDYEGTRIMRGESAENKRKKKMKKKQQMAALYRNIRE